VGAQTLGGSAPENYANAQLQPANRAAEFRLQLITLGRDLRSITDRKSIPAPRQQKSVLASFSGPV
jgi:hypothetical protein